MVVCAAVTYAFRVWALVLCSPKPPTTTNHKTQPSPPSAAAAAAGSVERTVTKPAVRLLMQWACNESGLNLSPKGSLASRAQAALNKHGGRIVVRECVYVCVGGEREGNKSSSSSSSA